MTFVKRLLWGALILSPLSAVTGQVLINLSFDDDMVGNQPTIADVTFSPNSNSSTNGVKVISSTSDPVNPLDGKSLYVYDQSNGDPTHMRFPFNGGTNRTEVRLSFDFQRAYSVDETDTDTRVHVALGRVGDRLNNFDFRPFELRILNNGGLWVNALEISELVKSYLTDSTNHIDILANSHDLNSVEYNLPGIGMGTVLPNTLHLFLNGAKVNEYDFHVTPDPVDAPQIKFNEQDDDLGQLAIYQDTSRQGGIVFDNIILSPINEIFGPPASPESLALVEANPFSVEISWDDVSDDETGFVIERKSDSETSFSVINTVTTDVTSFIDETVLPETEYAYRVVADNGFKSAPSNELIVTTLEQVVPLIIETKGNDFVLVGNTARLSVDVVGRAPLSYRWYQGASGDVFSPVSGATAADFESDPLSADVNFWVRVTNDEGQVDSDTFSIEVRTAVTYPVTNRSEIEAALETALPGDTLVLQNGVYQDLVIEFEGSGVEGAPITFMAETAGQVILQGASRMEIGGQWLVVDGLVFTGPYSGNDDEVIQFRANGVVATDCRLTNTSIIDYVPEDGAKTSWVSLYGERNRVDHCYLSGHDVIGVTLVVWLDGEPDYHRIDNNHFANRIDGGGENGWETIRIGTSDTSLSDSRTTVENNLFDRVNGEIEIISNKSGENVYRNNTFYECRGTLTLRHGNRCVVDGNYFIGNFINESGGVRVIGEDHVIINNYFESTTARDGAAITLYPGVPGGALNEYFASNNAVVAFNTFFNNTGPLIEVGSKFGDRDRTLLPTGMVIANNVMVAGSQTSGTFVIGQNPRDHTWAGNLIFGRPMGGGLTEGFTVLDPLLELDGTTGIQRISPASPGVDAASDVYDSVTVDIDGQERDSSPDVGADERSAEAGLSNGPLAASDVGPSYAPSQRTINTSLNVPLGENGWPTLLSETGAFKNLSTLEPEEGLLGYEPNISFWSDHAKKSRWVYIPVGSRIGFSENRSWTFPEGSVWVKHFDLELERGNPATAVRVETRFLVKTSFGSYGVSYRWNEAGTEATLVPDAGVEFDFTISEGGEQRTQTWSIPSRSQCIECHTFTAGHALSFNTRQLNRTQVIDGKEQNLLSYLSDHEYFEEKLENPGALPYFAPADDANASLDFKARSYLAVNCVSCHQPGGTEADPFDVRPERLLSQTRLIDQVPSINNGDDSLRIVLRENPDKSTLLLRMLAEQGFTRMPPLGSNELDLAGADLIRDWITSLSDYQSFSEWQDEQFGADKGTMGGADDDPDKDGRSNRQEFLDQTNPNSASDRTRVNVIHADGAMNLSVRGGSFADYFVETSVDLDNWRMLDGELGRSITVPEGAETATLQLPDDILEKPGQFFRTRVEER